MFHFNFFITFNILKMLIAIIIAIITIILYVLFGINDEKIGGAIDNYAPTQNVSVELPLNKVTAPIFALMNSNNIREILQQGNVKSIKKNMDIPYLKHILMSDKLPLTLINEFDSHIKTSSDVIKIISSLYNITAPVHVKKLTKASIDKYKKKKYVIFVAKAIDKLILSTKEKNLVAIVLYPQNVALVNSSGSWENYGEMKTKIDEAYLDDYVRTTNNVSEYILIYENIRPISYEVSSLMDMDGEINDKDLILKAKNYYVTYIAKKNAKVLCMSAGEGKLITLIAYYCKENNKPIHTLILYDRMFSIVPLSLKVRGILSSLVTNLYVVNNPTHLTTYTVSNIIDVIISVNWDPIPLGGDQIDKYMLVRNEYEALAHLKLTSGNIMWYDFSRRYIEKSSVWDRVSMGSVLNFHIDKTTLRATLERDILPYLLSLESNHDTKSRIVVPLLYTIISSQYPKLDLPSTPKHVPVVLPITHPYQNPQQHHQQPQMLQPHHYQQTSTSLLTPAPPLWQPPAQYTPSPLIMPPPVQQPPAHLQAPLPTSSVQKPPASSVQQPPAHIQAPPPASSVQQPPAHLQAPPPTVSVQQPPAHLQAPPPTVSVQQPPAHLQAHPPTLSRSAPARLHNPLPPPPLLKPFAEL
jgi:hypothetical protein